MGRASPVAGTSPGGGSHSPLQHRQRSRPQPLPGRKQLPSPRICLGGPLTVLLYEPAGGPAQLSWGHLFLLPVAQASPHQMPPEQAPLQGMCAELPQGHPYHPVPAAGTRLPQLSEHPAGERGASLCWQYPQPQEHSLGGGAGAGMGPTHQHPIYPHSLLSTTRLSYTNRGEREEHRGHRGPGLVPGSRANSAPGKVSGPSFLGSLSISLSTMVGPSNQFWGNRKCPLRGSLVVFVGFPCGPRDTRLAARHCWRL